MLNKSLKSFHCPSVIRIVSRRPVGENPKIVVTELGTSVASTYEYIFSLDAA